LLDSVQHKFELRDEDVNVFLQDGGISRFDDLFKKTRDESETPAESDDEEGVVCSFI